MSDRIRTLFPSGPGEFVLRNLEGKEVMRFPWNQTPPPRPPEPQAGLVESAFKRGLANTQSDFTNAAGLLAETLGQDEFARGFYEKAEEFAQKAATYEPTIGRVENIKNVGDVGAFLVETLVEQAPLLASMLIPGGIVAKGAQLAGATVKGASIAGTSAAFLSNVGLQTGESTSIARDAGKTPVDVRVIGSGLGKAALDFAPMIGIAKRLGLLKNLPISTTMEKVIVGNLADRGFIRRAAGHAGAIVAREVPTEVAQEIINIALQRTMQEYGGDLTAEEGSQLLNAAAGATAFGLLGIPAGIRKPAPDIKGQTESGTPEGVDIQIDETIETLNVDIPQAGAGFDSGGVDLSPNLQGTVDVIDETTPIASVGEFFDPIPIFDPKLPPLETASAPGTQRAAAQKAAIEEPALTDTAYYIDMNGDMIASIDYDPMLVQEGGTDPVSVGLDLTRAQLEVASAYPQYLDSDPSSPEGQSIAALHPGLVALYELRGEVLNDKSNYRSTDGQMKKDSIRRINVLDVRIEKLQENLGIQPVVMESHESTPENVQEGEIFTEPVPPPLTDRQKAKLETLAEKEYSEGLTQSEMDTYAELIGIASGEFGPVERQKQTQAQLTETAQLARDVTLDETQLQQPKLATTQNIPGTGLNNVDAKTFIEGFIRHFKYGPTVKLVSRDNPTARMRRKRAGKEVRGWWDPKEAGVVYLVPNNHFSEQSLIQTYMHETLAHYGMGTFLTRNEQHAILTEIVKNPPSGFNIDKLRESSQDRGEILKLWTEAEEYIASVAERAIVDPNTGLVQVSWWKRMMAMIKRFLNRNTKFKWNDDDIMIMLRDTSKLLTGRITPRNLAGWKSTEEIRADIAKLNEDLLNVDRYVKGEIADPPFDLALLVESEGDMGRVEINHSKERIRAKIKDKEREMESAGFFPRNSEMFAVLEANGDIANDAIDSLGSVWKAQLSKMFLTPLQFNSKYNVPGGNQFIDITQQWWARKRTLTFRAAQLADTFKSFGRRDQQKLAQVTMEMSIRSDNEGRKLTPEEQLEVFKQVGIENDAALIQQWKEMDKTFADVIVQLRKGLETIAIRTQGRKDGVPLTKEGAESLQRQYEKALVGTANDRKAMWQALGAPTMLRLGEIDEEMKQLQNRNYFPRMRFGTWAITIRAKKDMTVDGKSFKGPGENRRGEVIYFETFEDEFGQRAAFQDLGKQFGKNNFEMQLGRISENEFHFMGAMSPQLYEDLGMKIPDMTEVQKEALREIYLRQAPGRSFLRHLTKRKGIDGYSQDVLRVYSSYMMNVANHIARVEYHLDFQEQLKVINENAAITTPDANIAGIVRDYFQSHYDYLMNPKNDLAHLRATGFLWYLGANVKSAVVNLTQVPMVAYPYLASQYGDARSSAAILNAMQLVTRKIRNGEILSPELRTALEQAVREGFVDESFATSLAAQAEQGVLQRLIPESKTGRALSNASYYGAFLFQKAERWNREVTFIAAYNLAKQNGVTSTDEAFKAGRKAVQTAMFEYAKWNRPQFMRGKKSVFFLFWQYMQGLSYMAFGGAGQGAAMRLWMMLLLAGGLQGLPFAENMLDILDFVGTQTKQRLGMKDPRVDLRNDLRELANDITDRPDLIMHGLSRYYGLGPLHLLNMFEIPVPNVDISGSISAGRVLPGIDEVLSPERDPSAKLGRTMIDVFGPVAAIPYQVFRAAMDQNPNTWKVWERTLPSAMKSMSTALRRSNIESVGGQGAETFRGGGEVARFSPQETEHRAENLAQFFGFATTRVNQRYESDFSIENMKRYWVIRRALIMENVAYARMAGDPETIKDAWAALRTFNDSTPDPALRINGDQLTRSLKQRFRRASLRERGIPSELLFRRISQSMRELYPETEVEIELSSRR